MEWPHEIRMRITNIQLWRSRNLFWKTFYVDLQSDSIQWKQKIKQQTVLIEKEKHTNIYRGTWFKGRINNLLDVLFEVV